MLLAMHMNYKAQRFLLFLPVPNRQYRNAANSISCWQAEIHRVKSIMRLCTAKTDWSAWHIYFGDERCLPPLDPARNSRMAEEVWLNNVPIPALQLHMIAGELGANEAARQYAAHSGQSATSTWCCSDWARTGTRPVCFPVMNGEARPVHRIRWRCSMHPNRRRSGCR